MGAPIGGRVHWFIWNLSPITKKLYRLSYDYDYHNYRLARFRRRTLIDEFVIIRTSRRCFRVMYFNAENNYFEYFSAQTSKQAAEMVDKKINRQIEAERREKRWLF